MKRAFTLLELVFVIGILAILFGVGKFYTKNDNNIHLAAEQVLADIAYTRALAMLQHPFRAGYGVVATKDEWFKARWVLHFSSSKSTAHKQGYAIYLDKNGDGNANVGKVSSLEGREIAVSLLNPTKLLVSGQSGVIDSTDERASGRFDLESTFGVREIELFGSCGKSGSNVIKRLTFDEFGRLHLPLRTATKPYDKVLSATDAQCAVRLKGATNAVCIVLSTLTGHAYIPKFNAYGEQNFDLNAKSVSCEKL